MKAVVEMGPSNLPEGVQSGRVSRRRDVENEEIQMYLSKLKDLVPFMPKNRKISKLEVIRHVIEYICELQYALESHPAVQVDPMELAARLASPEPVSNGTTTSGGRQPLGILAPSPNTIVTSSTTSGPSSSPSHATADSSRSMSPSNLDKSQESDTRPVSC